MSQAPPDQGADQPQEVSPEDEAQIPEMPEPVPDDAEDALEAEELEEIPLDLEGALDEDDVEEAAP